MYSTQIQQPMSAVVIAAMALLVGVGTSGDVAADEVDDEVTECDEFVESYLRSSARKLGRALARDEYGLEPVDISEPFEVGGDKLDTDESVEFEVFREDDGNIAGVADIRRQWVHTYIVADGVFGPIIVSQTWQPRHLRETQTCEPIASGVEWPALTASSVDIEPFRYWGLRAAWRIPSPDNAEETDRSLQDVLIDVMKDQE